MSDTKTDKTEPMSASMRPLSPHLQVYRWQITMALSILHRATGIALSAGALMLVCWLWAAASGEAAYNQVHSFLASPLGLFMLLGWSWSFFYHLCAGLRHLLWDTGAALDIPNVYRTGYAVVAASFLLTAATWLWAWS